MRAVLCLLTCSTIPLVHEIVAACPVVPVHPLQGRNDARAAALLDGPQLQGQQDYAVRLLHQSWNLWEGISREERFSRGRMGNILKAEIEGGHVAMVQFLYCIRSAAY